MTGERIRKIRKHFNLRQQTFAEALNIKAAAISQLESDRTKPSLDTMLLITQKYGINLHWLLTGQGEMFQEAPRIGEKASNQLAELQRILNDQLNEIILTKEEIINQDNVDMRISGEIAAGLPVESIDNDLDVISVKRRVIQGNIEEYICLRVNGHSMEPEIRHNDVILIRQSQDWEKLSGRICAVRIDGAITLKKLTLDSAQKLIILVSLNEDYKPIIVSPDDHQDINLIGHLYFLFRKLSSAS